MADDTEQRIAVRAYEIWNEEGGCSAGTKSTGRRRGAIWD
jgi:hypothetical protein